MRAEGQVSVPMALLLGHLRRCETRLGLQRGVGAVAVDERSASGAVAQEGRLMEDAKLAGVGPDVDEVRLLVEDLVDITPLPGLGQVNEVVGSSDEARCELRLGLLPRRRLERRCCKDLGRLRDPRALCEPGLQSAGDLVVPLLPRHRRGAQSPPRQLRGVRPVALEERGASRGAAEVGGLVEHAVLADLGPEVHEVAALVEDLEDIAPLPRLRQVDEAVRSRHDQRREV
mmetsp:Transcript_88551/g.247669  ORF Transcript_88551/g.247669 Transcript_88551/m.247669 type:complete len:230 (-) Transcript_88551:896-1585(-)